MKSAIWISYDLGVQGDYEGIYAWLDQHDAKECGDSLAFLNYEYSTALLEDLKNDLESAVKIPKRARIYVIYRDRVSGRNKGNFVVGGRKAAPWSGFAVAAGPEDSDQT